MVAGAKVKAKVGRLNENEWFKQRLQIFKYAFQSAAIHHCMDKEN